jgi:hypothetical protein
LQYREALNHLRDILFERQRRQTRRYDHDRRNKTCNYPR